MTDRQAEYLLAIVEEGSITKAAKRLYVSQPSLSQMVRSVERKYGVVLFERKAGSLKLTYAGEKFIDNVRQMAQLERLLVQQLREIDGGRAGRLSFGITASKGLYLLPEVLPDFRDRFPNIELEIFEGTNQVLEEMIGSRSIDLAVLNYTVHQRHLEYVELPEEEMLLVTPPFHALAARHQARDHRAKRPAVSLKAIENEPFVYMPPHHGVRTVVDSIFTSLGIHPPKALEISNNATAYALTAAGVGVTILPDNFIRYVVSDHRCRYFSISDAVYRRKVAVCHPKAPTVSKSIAYLVDLIRTKMVALYKSSKDRL